MVHQISSLNDYFNFGWFEIISYLVFEDKIEEGQVFVTIQVQVQVSSSQESKSKSKSKSKSRVQVLSLNSKL